MKKVHRETFLRQLESVVSGLSASVMKETVEQSSCFAFKDGNIITYNDEVSCSIPCEVEIDGAVRSKALMSLLSKLTSEYIHVGKEEGQLRVRSGKKKSVIRMEDEILLPLDLIEKPEKWKELPEDFTEAIKITHSTTGTDNNRFILTCIHIHPDFIESCDRQQLVRYDIQIGIKEPLLVRGASIKNVIGLGVTHFSQTKNWIHFKNQVGLVFSCRLYIEDYVDMSDFLNVKGQKATLPNGLRSAAETAEIFASENIENDMQIEVHLRADRLKIRGEGSSGWYSEFCKMQYDGPPIAFLISPKLLAEISQNHNECIISKDVLFIDGGKYKYATALGRIQGE